MRDAIDQLFTALILGAVIVWVVTTSIASALIFTKRK